MAGAGARMRRATFRRHEVPGCKGVGARYSSIFFLTTFSYNQACTGVTRPFSILSTIAILLFYALVNYGFPQKAVDP